MSSDLFITEFDRQNSSGLRNDMRVVCAFSQMTRAGYYPARAPTLRPNAARWFDSRKAAAGYRN
jgi:hypothetical protein